MDIMSRKSTDQIRDFENMIFTIMKKDEEIPYLVKVGSYVFQTYSDELRLYEVIGFKNKYSERPEWDKDAEQEKYIMVTLKPIFSRDYDYNKDGSPRIDQISLDKLEREYRVSNKVDIEEFKILADKILKREISTEDLNDFKSISNVSTSTELMTTKSQEYYETMLDNVREADNKIAIIKGIVAKEVENIKYQIRAITDDLQKTVKKLNKIVFTLTIYAGLTEDVIQISEGVPAPLDSPVNLQQNMLFMDEEVGDPENGGISFDSVQKFYDWMNTFNHKLGYKNYNLILPHDKCIAIMRVRREVSERYQTRYDVFGNSWEALQEMKTCMLIRNGENIYAIHSDMHFSTKLFPDREEFTQLIEKIKENHWRESEKAEDMLDQYKNGMVLIQGIFDRTNLLAPIGSISIINGADLNNGKVFFNYGVLEIEDSNDKSRTFFRWIGNKDNVRVGNQILFNGFGGGYSYKDRIVKYYREYCYPKPPKTREIYTVEEYEGGRLSFLYLPDEEIWDRKKQFYKKRERKERVILRPDLDRFIIMDDFSHRDYEYIKDLMYDRKHRRSYLWLVPLFETLKNQVEKIRKQEEPFAGLIKCEFPDISEETILDYLFWWKTKNKWKRMLSTDDNKAFRMIKSRLKKDIKENTLITYEQFF